MSENTITWTARYNEIYMLMCGMPSSTYLREEMIRILKWTDGAGNHRRLFT